MNQAVLCSLITAVLFATLEPCTKLIANDVTPYAITFWRFIISAVVLFPAAVSAIRKNKITISRKDGLGMAFWGVIFVCVCMISLQLCIKLADSPAVVSIIFSSNSIFTIIFSVFILKERFTRYKAIALALGIGGVLICADLSSGTSLMSAFLAVFSAATFSLYTIMGRRYSAKYGGTVQACISFTSGSLVLLGVLAVLGVDLSPGSTMTSVATLCCIGVFVSGIGYICYFTAIEKGGAIMASLVYFIKPILTPYVAWFVNGVVPGVNVYVAVVLIVGASYFATYKKKTVEER